MGGLAAGLILYVMPFWPEGRLNAAFWVTLLSTLLHIYTSHKRTADADSETPLPDPTGGVGGESSP